MTPESAKALLPIITAYAEGKVIQHHSAFRGWEDTLDIGYLDFNDAPNRYRIKPEPKQVLMTIDELPAGMIWLKFPAGYCELVLKFYGDTLSTRGHAASLEIFHDEGVTWSTDRKTWNSFMREEAAIITTNI